tara:strand:- start:44 stop:253 length:210 start_codon:yes stop_codon:yes gene_type:complete
MDNNAHNTFIMKVANSICDKANIELMSEVELEALNSLLDGNATEHDRDILNKVADRFIELHADELGNED